ncbi:MAG: hypothetical protein V7784_16035 [Oceanospirillaceae bacterium]
MLTNLKIKTKSQKVALFAVTYSIVFAAVVSFQQAIASEANTKVKVKTLKAIKKVQLNAELNEVSGLASTRDLYWGINDSGGEAILYGFDQNTYKLKKRIAINNAFNLDWEELAEDDNYIYIADTGNNIAIRQSADIYIVAKNDLNAASNTASVSSSAMQIVYADKQNYLPQRKHNFDSEALTVVGNELWLFSKNRKDFQTKLYRVNKHKAEQTLSPEESFPVEGLITAADYNAKSQQLLLLGYSKKSAFGHSFIWRIDVRAQNLDWQSAVRYTIKPYAQWESIVWKGDKQFVLGAENSGLTTQMVAEFKLP